MTVDVVLISEILLQLKYISDWHSELAVQVQQAAIQVLPHSQSCFTAFILFLAISSLKKSISGS